MSVYADLRQKERPNHKRGSPYEKYRSLVHTLVLKKQTSKQIKDACRSKGYKGSLSTLNTMIAEERRKTKGIQSESYSFRQKIINIIWDFEKGNHIERFRKLHSNLLEAFPPLQEIDELVRSFRNLFIEKSSVSLNRWLNQYKQSNYSHVQAFINGLMQDIDAVRLSVQEDWNNGVTEGHVNRLKTIKRLMYGRASFSVLKNRVLYHF